MAIKKRSVAFVVIMSLITSGIYPIYWFVQTSRELRELTSSDKPKLKHFIIGMCLYIAGVLGLFIGQFVMGGAALAGMSMATSGSEAAGVSTMCCGALVVPLVVGALLITGAVFSLMFMWQHAKAIETISGGSRGAGGLMALWILFSPVAYGLSQAELNKRAGETSAPQKAPAKQVPATTPPKTPAATPTKPTIPAKPTTPPKPAPQSRILPPTPSSTPKKPKPKTKK